MWLTDGITGRPAAIKRRFSAGGALLVGYAHLVVLASASGSRPARPAARAGGIEVVKMKPAA